MDLWQMTVSAAVLILVIAAIRAVGLRKMPKKVFLVLWVVVLARLLVPFSVPLPFTISMPVGNPVGLITETAPPLTLPERPMFVFPPVPQRGETGAGLTPPATEGAAITPPIDGAVLIPPISGDVALTPPGTAGTVLIPPITENAAVIPPATESAARVLPRMPQISPSALFPFIWVMGMVILALFFVATHLRWRGEYKAALPVENDLINRWLQSNKTRRRIQVRVSDRINAPMTYGLLKPVILFPKSTNWQDTDGLLYILTHELMHIRRFDILTKWLLAAALCVHWFNPLVWVMYVLANRDIEYACDEAVVRSFGDTAKSSYALTLLNLEEKRSGFFPIHTNFAKNAIKERTRLIMKMKKHSIISVVVAVLLVSALAVSAFFVSARTNDGLAENLPEGDASAYNGEGSQPLTLSDIFAAVRERHFESPYRNTLRERETWAFEANPADIEYTRHYFPEWGFSFAIPAEWAGTYDFHNYIGTIPQNSSLVVRHTETYEAVAPLIQGNDATYPGKLWRFTRMPVGDGLRVAVHPRRIINLAERDGYQYSFQFNTSGNSPFDSYLEMLEQYAFVLNSFELIERNDELDVIWEETRRERRALSIWSFPFLEEQEQNSKIVAAGMERFIYDVYSINTVDLPWIAWNGYEFYTEDGILTLEDGVSAHLIEFGFWYHEFLEEEMRARFISFNTDIEPNSDLMYRYIDGEFFQPSVAPMYRFITPRSDWGLVWHQERFGPSGWYTCNLLVYIDYRTYFMFLTNSQDGGLRVNHACTFDDIWGTRNVEVQDGVMGLCNNRDPDRHFYFFRRSDMRG